MEWTALLLSRVQFAFAARKFFLLYRRQNYDCICSALGVARTSG